MELQDTRIFGYSLGAGVALEVARQRPDAVSRLALHATNTQWAAREVERMTTGLREMAPEAEARMAQLHGGLWRDAVAQMIAFSERLPDDWIADDALASITAPALVSIGDSDALFTVEHALHLSRAVARGHLWVLPGATHNLATLDADAFARGVAAHLLA